MMQKPFALSLKVIVRDNAGRCLLLKRSPNSKGNPGKWEFPGGKVEPGEDFDAGLLREVAEETGLVITLNHVAGTAEFDLPARKVVYLILEGHLVSGQVHLSSEHTDYTWVAPSELTRVDIAEQFIALAHTYSQAHAR